MHSELAPPISWMYGKRKWGVVRRHLTYKAVDWFSRRKSRLTASTAVSVVRDDLGITVTETQMRYLLPWVIDEVTIAGRNIRKSYATTH